MDQSETDKSHRTDKQSQLLMSELNQVKNHLNREMGQQLMLQCELSFIKNLLRRSITDDRQSLLIHKLKSDGMIRDARVFEALIMTDLSDAFDDEDEMPGLEETVKEYAKILQCVAPYVTRGSKVLVLIGIPVPLIVCFAHLITDFASCRDDDANSSSSNGMNPSRGSLITKPLRSDVRILMKKYKHLIETGVLRINTFSDSSNLRNGYKKSAPYDLIVVPEIGWSESLKSQVKTGGLVINPLDLSSKLVKTHDDKFVTV